MKNRILLTVFVFVTLFCFSSESFARGTCADELLSKWRRHSMFHVFASLTVIGLGPSSLFAPQTVQMRRSATRLKGASEMMADPQANSEAIEKLYLKLMTFPNYSISKERIIRVLDELNTDPALRSFCLSLTESEISLTGKSSGELDLCSIHLKLE